MLLVPKQLQRVGMTGSVPYYGGRFTPAQAYAASHPTAPPPSTARAWNCSPCTTRIVDPRPRRRKRERGGVPLPVLHPV